ncbi:MAG: zf-HC2 domain-containing protein [Bryobacteraceae bacterium]
MNRSVHEQARELIAAGADDLVDKQQAFLQAHLRECPSCRDYAEATGRVVRALRSQSFAADSALVQATRMRVRARAAELRQQQERRWLVCVACLFVGLSAAITTSILWRAFEWVSVWGGVSNWVWQAIFAIFWIAPALAVSAVLVARGIHLSDSGGTQWT